MSKRKTRTNTSRKRTTRTNRSRKRTTRTNRLRKNKTSRRINKTSRRTRTRTRKGKTSRRINKTSRRRTRKGNTSRRINKNKVYSGGNLIDNITIYEKGANKCASTPNMSWIKEGEFCMVKPASTIINKANITADIINKYILKPFKFDEKTPWLELVDEMWQDVIRSTHEKPDAPDDEIGRNFYRTNVGSRSDQGLFFNSESDPYNPEITELKEGDEGYEGERVVGNTNLTPEQANECIENLGKKIRELGLIGDVNLTELAKKIMNYVDTTSLPSYTFPALVDAAFQTTPPIFRCMVGEGYIFVFIYYYLPMGDAELMGTGRVGDGKYSSFVVRAISNNLYSDKYDERFGTIQIFPTEIVSINGIVDTDENFRESFIDEYLLTEEYTSIQQKLTLEKMAKLEETMIDNMVAFIKENSNDFHKWARESEWSKDTGGERDKNKTPLRVIEDPNWIEKWSKAKEIVVDSQMLPFAPEVPVSPPDSPEVSKLDRLGIELVPGVEDDL